MVKCQEQHCGMIIDGTLMTAPRTRGHTSRFCNWDDTVQRKNNYAYGCFFSRKDGGWGTRHEPEWQLAAREAPGVGHHDGRTVGRTSRTWRCIIARWTTSRSDGHRNSHHY